MITEDILLKFEKVNDEVKRLITKYQSGFIEKHKLIDLLSELHEEISLLLVKQPIFLQKVSELNYAYSKICQGDMKYLVEANGSYHNILFQLHHNLVGLLAGKAKKIGNCLITNYKQSLPSDLEAYISRTNQLDELESKINRQGAYYHIKVGNVITLTRDGYIIRADTGAQYAHYTQIERVGKKVTVTVCDILGDRGLALAQVISEELCFNLWGTQKMVLSRADWRYHHLFILKKNIPVNMSSLAEALFFGADIYDTFWVPCFIESLQGEVNRPPEEGTALFEKSVILHKEVLRWRLKNPEKATKAWQPVFTRFYYDNDKEIKNPLVDQLEKETVETVKETLQKLLYG